MNRQSPLSLYLRYAKNIILITIVVIVLGFFLIPQFSTLRYKRDDAVVHPEKAEPPVKETKHLSPDTTSTYTDPITKMEFVFVQGGCYDMGDVYDDGDADEKPVHKVCVDDFYIGKYEVTREQWYAVMLSAPTWNGRSRCVGNCPAEGVSWDRAQSFVNALNKRSGKRYRLPSEAEWEYAARSRGKKEEWSGTNNEMQLGVYAWYDANSDGVVHPVGQKRPNGLGLYDMSGNVWEWVADRYDKNYYVNSTQNNPQGPKSGSHHIQRGGSWFFRARDARTSTRADLDPGRFRRGHDLFGLRLAIDH